MSVLVHPILVGALLVAAACILTAIMAALLRHRVATRRRAAEQEQPVAELIDEIIEARADHYGPHVALAPEVAERIYTDEALAVLLDRGYELALIAPARRSDLSVSALHDSSAAWFDALLLRNVLTLQHLADQQGAPSLHEALLDFVVRLTRVVSWAQRAEAATEEMARERLAKELRPDA